MVGAEHWLGVPLSLIRVVWAVIALAMLSALPYQAAYLAA